MTKANEALTTAVEHLTERVAVLTDSVDELRDVIRSLIENNVLSPSEPDIAAVVESAVENSFNDFSIDMQWAVRQIQTAAESVKKQLELFSREQ